MLYKIRERYGEYIGLLLVFSVSYLAVAIIMFIFRRLRKWWFGRKYKKMIVEKLLTLSPEEASIIGTFYDRATGILKDVSDLDYCNSSVKNLMNHGIIIAIANDSVPAGFTSDYSRFTAFMPFALSKVAKKHINIKNGDLFIERSLFY